MYFRGNEIKYPTPYVVHCLSCREAIGRQPTGWDQTTGSDVSEPDRGSVCVYVCLCERVYVYVCMCEWCLDGGKFTPDWEYGVSP